MPDGHTTPPPFRTELALVSDHSDPTKVGQCTELVIAAAKQAGFRLASRSIFEVSEAGELCTPKPPCGDCGRYHRDAECPPGWVGDEELPVVHWTGAAA